MRICSLLLAVLFLVACTPTAAEFSINNSIPEQRENFFGKATLIPAMMWLTNVNGVRCALNANGFVGVIECDDGRMGVYRFLDTPLNHSGTFEGVLDGEKVIGSWWRSPTWPR